MNRLLVNFVCFEALWLLVIVTAAQGRAVLGIAMSALWWAVHLWRSAHRQREMQVMMVAAALGAVLDSLLVLAGQMSFPAPAHFGPLTTSWMVVLWINLAATLNGCLRWLRGRLWLTAALGAVSAPLAYYSGMQLGAIQLAAPLPQSLGMIALVWLGALPLLVGCNEWLAAHAARQSAQADAANPMRPEGTP